MVHENGRQRPFFSCFSYPRIQADAEFAIQTAGGKAHSTVFEAGQAVRVDMGRVSFWSNAIPGSGPRQEVLQEPLTAGDRVFTVCCATGLHQAPAGNAL